MSVSTIKLCVPLSMGWIRCCDTVPPLFPVPECLKMVRMWGKLHQFQSIDICQDVWGLCGLIARSVPRTWSITRIVPPPLHLHRFSNNAVTVVTKWKRRNERGEEMKWETWPTVCFWGDKFDTVFLPSRRIYERKEERIEKENTQTMSHHFNHLHAQLKHF